jgi:hypothetical protein
MVDALQDGSSPQRFPRTPLLRNASWQGRRGPGSAWCHFVGTASYIPGICSRSPGEAPVPKSRVRKKTRKPPPAGRRPGRPPGPAMRMEMD